MKLLVRAVLFLALLAGLAVAAIALFGNRIAGGAVEEASTRTLGVETRLENLAIHPIQGSVGLSGFTLANPEGFDAPTFLSLGSGDLALNLRSLLGDHVVVPLFSLERLDLVLERRDGKFNYQVLQERALGEGSGEEPAPSEGGGKKFTIEKVRLADMRVTFDLGPPLGNHAVTLPDLALDNVGSESGSDLGEIISELVDWIAKAAIENGGDLLPEDIQAEWTSLKGDLEAQADDLLEDLEQDVGKALDGLLKRE